LLQHIFEDCVEKNFVKLKFFGDTSRICPCNKHVYFWKNAIFKEATFRPVEGMVKGVWMSEIEGM